MSTSRSGAVCGSVSLPSTLQHTDQGNQTSDNQTIEQITRRWLYPSTTSAHDILIVYLSGRNRWISVDSKEGCQLFVWCYARRHLVSLKPEVTKFGQLKVEFGEDILIGSD